MQTKNNGLKLHTRQIPENATPMPEQTPPKRRLFSRASATKPSKRSFSTVRTASAERILRHTSIACALLLTVLALRSIDSPFTNRITGALNQAISMDLSLDQSLGQLSFVENIMPESALVFFHMKGSRAINSPVDGQAAHAWSKEQPWIEYRTADNAKVYALKGGTICAATQSTSGDWTVLIDHGDGSQTVYAYLAECSVTTAAKVAENSVIGTTGSGENARLYLEYRVDSQPRDPFDETEGLTS